MKKINWGNQQIIDFLDTTKSEWEKIGQELPLQEEDIFALQDIKKNLKQFSDQLILFQIDDFKDYINLIIAMIDAVMQKFEKEEPYDINQIQAGLQFFYDTLAAINSSQKDSFEQNSSHFYHFYQENQNNFEPENNAEERLEIDTPPEWLISRLSSEKKFLQSRLETIDLSGELSSQIYQEIAIILHGLQGILSVGEDYFCAESSLNFEKNIELLKSLERTIFLKEKNKALDKILPKIIAEIDGFVQNLDFELFQLDESYLNNINEHLLKLENSKEINADKPSQKKEVSDKAKVEDIQEENSIKIKESLLNKFSDLINEIYVVQSSFGRILAMTQNNILDDEISEFFQNTDKNFNRVLQDITDLFISIRMQNLSSTMQRFRRFVRDFASKNNKKINFVGEGTETKIDSLILKQLSDPFMHMIRNSCDHGIEDVETRKENGKPESGTIKISALNKGDRIVFEIMDDGAGLSEKKLKQKAIEKGLYSEDEINTFSQEMIYNLIFHPGFSTNQEVTEVSGRGVGMDVVRQTIAQMKGNLQLESEEGKYTKFIIDLPMTTGISRGVIFSVRDNKYLIPLEFVVKFVSISSKDINSHVNPAVIYFKEKPIPLFCMREELFGEEPVYKNNDDVEVLGIVINYQKKSVCLTADNIVRIESIALKPMPNGVRQTRFFQGCSVQSDGSVIPVIKIDEFID